MASKKRNNGFFSDRYMQSEALNQRTYTMYRDWILSLAITRFKWINLPPTCDERYLERELLFNGMASIAFPRSQPGTFYTNKVTPIGQLNVYDNPAQWRAIGNNGWNFYATPKQGTVVYDNRLRVPILNQIDLFARRLAQLDRTMDINLLQQHNPVILAVSQEQRADALNLVKQVAGGEPLILGSKGLTDLKDAYQVLDLKVDFIAQDIQAAKQNVWNEVYTWLGLDSLPTKAERMIEEEVMATNEPASMRALDPLTTRREAAQWLNDTFGTKIDVVWRQDNGSDNYNQISNLKCNQAGDWTETGGVTDEQRDLP